jgi:hypothetical protein
MTCEYAGTISECAGTVLVYTSTISEHTGTVLVYTGTISEHTSTILEYTGTIPECTEMAAASWISAGHRPWRAAGACFPFGIRTNALDRDGSKKNRQTDWSRPRTTPMTGIAPAVVVREAPPAEGPLVQGSPPIRSLAMLMRDVHTPSAARHVSVATPVLTHAHAAPAAPGPAGEASSRTPAGEASSRTPAGEASSRTPAGAAAREGATS